MLRLLSSLCLPAVAMLSLVQCSGLPRPAPSDIDRTSLYQDAGKVVQRSATFSGKSWQRYKNVEVSYRGEWSKLSPKIQPVLVDADFRRSSDEIYRPRQASVQQTHRGPGGTKTVKRVRREPAIVTYNGKTSQDSEVIAAANLVTDAYTLFLFGTTWLESQKMIFRDVGQRRFEGEVCDLVAGTLRPGLGDAKEDGIIAWISQKTGLLRRIQFSINGLDSTRGADADVTFHDFLIAPDGSVWPTRFVEKVQRPFVFKAHEWELTGLKLDGEKIR